MPIAKLTAKSAIGQIHHGTAATSTTFELFCRFMPQLAANLSTLFPQLDFLERFAAARAAGFSYVEYQFPYAFGAEQLAQRARDAGVQVVLHNLPAGDMAKGERGIACLPGRERSEEHTSELQSRLHLVCRLLLEKKKSIHLFWRVA